MMTTAKLRNKTVAQGECSVQTHHTALLIVPQDCECPEDIEFALVYGVDSAEEAAEVAELPDVWEPAGQISGDEYHNIEGGFEWR